MIDLINKIIKGKNYFVKEIDSDIARDIVKKYHYSHKCVSNSKLHLGIYRFNNILVGALQFGPCMNGYKTSKKFHDSENYFELNRMVMIDDEPRNAESQALSLCFKWLKNFTNTDYLISFSDGKENNVGYIYQATNWIYIGYRLSSSFYDLDGDIIHSVTVWHRYKEKHKDRDIKTTNEILCDTFDNVSIITSKQHIYLYPLNKKTKFKIRGKQYPKLETEIPIIKRKIIKENCITLKKPLIKLLSTEYLESCI